MTWAERRRAATSRTTAAHRHRAPLRTPRRPSG
jgi:hypothetical protein